MSDEKDTKIGKGSWISVSLLGCIIGGVVWLTTIHNQSVANASDISEMKSSIKEDLAEIKVQLRFIIEQLLERE